MAAHYGAGVEYALHSLLYLVDRSESARATSTRDLADLQLVPPEYLAKLFTRLQRAGITASAEGIGGGVRFARSPNQVSVLDVVHAIEGTKPLFACREIRRRCALFPERPAGEKIVEVCSIHAVMLEAQAKMEATLAGWTLQDIADRVNTKLPGEFTAGVAMWLDKRALQRGKNRKGSL